MPSIFVNAGCKAVRDECEFIYGQGSGYLRRKKMCVSGHMEFQNRVGRFFFYFVQSFYMGMIGKQYVRTEKSLGIP